MDIKGEKRVTKSRVTKPKKSKKSSTTKITVGELINLLKKYKKK